MDLAVSLHNVVGASYGSSEHCLSTTTRPNRRTISKKKKYSESPQHPQILILSQPLFFPSILISHRPHPRSTPHSKLVPLNSTEKRNQTCPDLLQHSLPASALAASHYPSHAHSGPSPSMQTQQKPKPPTGSQLSISTPCTRLQSSKTAMIKTAEMCSSV